MPVAAAQLRVCMAWLGGGEQVGVVVLFFSRSSKSAFSRHDNAQARLALLMWLNENVGKEGFEKTQCLTEFMSVVSLTK